MYSDDDIKWKNVKEMRVGYFVEYHPANANFRLSSLSVTMLDKYSHEQIAEILEKEFGQWAKLYPIPLMATAADELDNVIDLSAVRNCDHIVGYYDPVTQKTTMNWDLMKDHEMPPHLLTDEHFKNVYKNLVFKTGKDIRENAERYAKNMRRTKYIILAPSFLWLLIIPVTIEFYARYHDWFANVVTFLSLGKGAWELLKVTGLCKRSKKEEKKSEEELKERHYIYHCKRNPDGFVRLKIENFEKEARERTRKEAESLSQSCNENPIN